MTHSRILQIGRLGTPTRYCLTRWSGWLNGVKVFVTVELSVGKQLDQHPEGPERSD